MRVTTSIPLRVADWVYNVFGLRVSGFGGYFAFAISGVLRLGFSECGFSAFDFCFCGWLKELGSLDGLGLMVRSHIIKGFP